MSKAATASPKSSNHSHESLGSTIITINKTEIPVEIVLVDVSTLLFYADNPRIYSIVRAGGALPTQDEIFDALREKQHVHQLQKDIRENGGLIDPLIVRTDSMEVLEGNSRLTAYRILAEKKSRQNGAE